MSNVENPMIAQGNKDWNTYVPNMKNKEEFIIAFKEEFLDWIEENDHRDIKYDLFIGGVTLIVAKYNDKLLDFYDYSEEVNMYKYLNYKEY